MERLTGRMPPALPIVRVIGHKKSGKTTLASNLITEFAGRGYRVAAVKRSHHAVPEDRAGSDTHRFAAAGAASVLFCGPDGALERVPGAYGALEMAVARITGDADIVIVEGFKDEDLGAVLRLGEGPAGTVRLETMGGGAVTTADAADAPAIVASLEEMFEMSAAGDENLRALVRRAAAAHGHLCPGITLGVRMVLAGLGALGIALPVPDRRLRVTVEDARCATDAMGSVTGCTAGKGDLRVYQYGKMAATFHDVDHDRAVRVLALESSRDLADQWAPGVAGRRHRQAVAYRLMPDELLFDVSEVRAFASVPPGEDGGGRPPRVTCAACGESVSARVAATAEPAAPGGAGADGGTDRYLCPVCAGAEPPFERLTAPV